MRSEKRQIPDHKILVYREKIIHHGDNYALHHRRIEDLIRKRVKQRDEGNKRENRVGRHAESEGVHLAVQQVTDQRRAVLAPVVPLGLLSRLLYIGGSGGLQ